MFKSSYVKQTKKSRHAKANCTVLIYYFFAFCEWLSDQGHCWSPFNISLSFLLFSNTCRKSVKVVTINARSVFFSPLRQLSALPDRQHATGRHCDHRRRPAAAVPRQPLRPLVLQFPRRPWLPWRPPNVLDPRCPGSKWMVSVLLFACCLNDELTSCRRRRRQT